MASRNVVSFLRLPFTILLTKSGSSTNLSPVCLFSLANEKDHKDENKLVYVKFYLQISKCHPLT